MPKLNLGFSANRKALGFTLVELIVAISIVSILTVSGVVIFSTTTKNSKDETRFKDITSIKQALQLYYQQNRYYPASYSDLVPNFLNSIQQDPTGSDYVYQASPTSCTTALKNCTSYVICAKKDGNKSYDIPSACKTSVCTSGQNDCMGVTSDD